ncbi:MAG: addiction module toxin, HicA family [Luteitalea sp.]|nr:addiction module toxin, HicA family [Luteitalea sp.]
MKAWTGTDLVRHLVSLGCRKVRQKGSHLRVACGPCVTTVAVHAGETLPPGTLRQIVRDLAPCLGKDWLP